MSGAPSALSEVYAAADAHPGGFAAGLAAQLETSIFSDDEDATEALRARIAEREAERDRVVRYNASCRKGAKAGIPGDTSILDERQRATLASCLKHQGYQCPDGQFPTYHLANLSGRIQADKKRLVSVERRELRRQEAEAAGGISVTRSGDFVRVTFSEKPERATLAALKGAGFFWSAGSWHGRAAALQGELASLGAL